MYCAYPYVSGMSSTLFQSAYKKHLSKRPLTFLRMWYMLTVNITIIVQDDCFYNVIHNVHMCCYIPYTDSYSPYILPDLWKTHDNLYLFLESISKLISVNQAL